MTSMQRPNFIDSPYFVNEPGNWHLKPGAPSEVQREFNRFKKAMNSHELLQDPAVLIDPKEGASHD